MQMNEDQNKNIKFCFYFDSVCCFIIENHTIFVCSVHICQSHLNTTAKRRVAAVVVDVNTKKKTYHKQKTAD